MIDWNKFFKEKRKMRELNKKGIILDRCKGCFFLKEREWDDEDYVGLIKYDFADYGDSGNIDYNNSRLDPMDLGCRVTGLTL